MGRGDEERVCMSGGWVGEVNVEMMMEAVEGGGDLRNAGSELSGI